MGNESSRPAVDPAVQAQADAKTIRRMDKVIRKKVRGGLTYNMKLLIRGERGTGKTSLMARLQGQPIPPTHEPTREIQTASIQWTMQTHEDTVKCELWDVVDVGIPSEDPIEAPSPDAVGRHPVALVDAQAVDVYQNAHCVIFLMDITKYSTLEYVRTQLDHVPVHIPTLVLGTFRDLRKDDVALKRAIFKDDVQTLLYGSHKDHKLPGFRRPSEMHYFEASLSNCYGLKALHTYLGVPFLHLKVATVKQQLRLLETELASTKAQVDVSIAGQKYSDFVANLAGADVKTGRRVAAPVAAAASEPLKDDELEDLPERDGGADGAASPVPLRMVHKAPTPTPTPAPVAVVAAPVAKAPAKATTTKADAPRTSWSKNETLEDFTVKTDMDKFYSSDDDSGDGTDEDVVVPTSVVAPRVFRKQDFIYSDSDDDDTAMYARPKTSSAKTSKKKKMSATKKPASPPPKAKPAKTTAAPPGSPVKRPVSPKAPAPIVEALPKPEVVAVVAAAPSPKAASPPVAASDSDDDTPVPVNVPAYITLPRRASAENIALLSIWTTATNSIEFSDDDDDDDDGKAPGPTVADLPPAVRSTASNDDCDVSVRTSVQGHASSSDGDGAESRRIDLSDSVDEAPLPSQPVVLDDSEPEDKAPTPHAIPRGDASDDDEDLVPSRPVVFTDSEEDTAPLPTRPVVLSDSDDDADVAAPMPSLPVPAMVSRNFDDKRSMVADVGSDDEAPLPSRPIVLDEDLDDDAPLPSQPVVLDADSDDEPRPTSGSLGLPSLPIVNVITSQPSPVVLAKPVVKKTPTARKAKMVVAMSDDDDSDAHPVSAPVVPPARRRKVSSSDDDTGDFKVEKSSTTSFWDAKDDDDDEETKEIVYTRAPRKARAAMPALPAAFSVTSAPAPVQMNSSVLAAIEEAKRAALAMLAEPSPSVADAPVSFAAPTKPSRVKTKKSEKPKKEKKPKKAKKPMTVLDSD
ncbi:hypothetical protein SPRG_13144 [Saprolegnia parasitica CBS 223.65]|uniref:GTP-binding protein Parf n=1 Tax=Saprolegnia parasitica (strain CBS 223.65) TaxID=695850 RepID=A0A067BU08_SAPPC|nr:hypothetical protein SPRG_13144 [Saprolegnia parasitica CBS 223.65]KDO21728.1 hypothetical protein SPRG_13144 [Saprolegnia parasitica CBS 223.65]|eukprot:XP_012207531.1 hypothetical protein SPRG_13144 [Saprolegnia parasitica CBS 223.65]